MKFVVVIAFKWKMCFSTQQREVVFSVTFHKTVLKNFTKSCKACNELNSCNSREVFFSFLLLFLMNLT
jgi:hypothetical protein